MELTTEEKLQAVKEWLAEVRKNDVPVSLWEPDEDPWDANRLSFNNVSCMLRTSHYGASMTIDDNGARFTTSSVPSLTMPFPFEIDSDADSLYEAMLVMKPLYEAEINKSKEEQEKKIDAEIAVLMKKKEALNDKV